MTQLGSNLKRHSFPKCGEVGHRARTRGGLALGRNRVCERTVGLCRPSPKVIGIYTCASKSMLNGVTAARQKWEGASIDDRTAVCLS